MVSLARLQAQIRLASKGRPLGIYEPAPGHCAMYPNFSASGNGPVVLVNLSGATVEVAETE